MCQRSGADDSGGENLIMWTCRQFFSPSVQFIQTAAACLPFHKDHWHLDNAVLFRVLSPSFPRELRSTGVEVFAMVVQPRPTLTRTSMNCQGFVYKHMQVQAQETLSVWFDLDISTTLIMNSCLLQGTV